MSGGQRRGAIRMLNQCAADAAPRVVELPGGAGKHNGVYALDLVGRVLVGPNPGPAQEIGDRQGLHFSEVGR
jgi:hypothetical protein